MVDIGYASIAGRSSNKQDQFQPNINYYHFFKMMTKQCKIAVHLTEKPK